MFYRGYDPAIGRMLQVDPYATMYPSVNVYNYSLNNPVMMNDPSGGQSEYVPGMNYNAWRRTQANYADLVLRDWHEDFNNEGGGHWAWGSYQHTVSYDLGNGQSGSETTTRYDWVWVSDGEPFSWKAQADDTDQLKEFLNFYFGNEVRQLKELATKNNWTIRWVLDAGGKDGWGKKTRPNSPGNTDPDSKMRIVTVSFNKILMVDDPRKLYVVTAHELVHVSDVISGNWETWMGWFGEYKTRGIMEYRAYEYSAYIEDQLGVDYGSANSVHNWWGRIAYDSELYCDQYDF